MIPQARRTVRTLLVLLLIGAACRQEEKPAAPTPSAPAKIARAVVVIHGVGNQSAGYSRDLQRGLNADDLPLHFVEVLWSDLGTMLLKQTKLDKEQQAAEREMLADLAAAERRARATRSKEDPQLRQEFAAARGYVGPIVRYEFLPGAERNRIQQRLRDALDWAGSHADRTYVVAHSLGSVIAFDTLHAWQGGSPPPRAALLTTIGSPLNNRLFVGRRGRPTAKPANVQTWVNFYSTADPIASALAASYHDVEDRSVKTSILPLSAHSAYWTHPDVLGGLLAKFR